MTPLPDNVAKALALYRKGAKQARESAGFDGSWGDGGASQMEEKATIFEMGWDHTLPEFLMDAYKEVIRTNDPQYAEYIILKKKFEGTEGA